MRELIDELKKLEEELDADSQEVADLGKKYGFGSIAWQQGMLDRLKRKLQNKEQLTGVDRSFIEAQVMHNKSLRDELKAMGADGIIYN